jgi:hypothetical protein
MLLMFFVLLHPNTLLVITRLSLFEHRMVFELFLLKSHSRGELPSSTVIKRLHQQIGGASVGGHLLTAVPVIFWNPTRGLIGELLSSAVGVNEFLDGFLHAALERRAISPEWCERKLPHSSRRLRRQTAGSASAQPRLF